MQVNSTCGRFEQLLHCSLLKNKIVLDFEREQERITNQNVGECIISTEYSTTTYTCLAE